MMALNYSAYLPKFPAAEAGRPGNTQAVEPHFGPCFVSLHVNVWRFVAIRREEVEPIRPGSQHCRQWQLLKRWNTK